MSHSKKALARRDFLAYMTAGGLAGTIVPDILWAKLKEGDSVTITREMLAEAQRLAGLTFTDNQRDLMLDGVNGYLQSYEQLRAIPLDNSVAPAIQFDPLPPDTEIKTRQVRKHAKPETQARKIPSEIEQMCFWPVADLAGAIKSRKVTSLELTRMYLERLKKYDPLLKCVVTITEDLALSQADRADREIASGKYRGPLHGIPWGAKDLFAVKGCKTTWGAMPYKDQTIDLDAAVVKRLEQAGAILVAKLTLGALAMGDVWYGGMTRNPWNPEKGSSGSSAGPAAATAAGLVAFSIGTETLGSIVSPCTVCGVTGLRPTFGRVSRHGAMALSWSMDKIGPMCRTAEDCALVFEAIQGPDGKDLSVRHAPPFDWNPDESIKELNIGYLKADFQKDRSNKKWKTNDEATLDKLRQLGANLIPIELPDYPVEAMRLILDVEAAAAFDELTRSGRDQLLVRQTKYAWPNLFRKARTVGAVEYIQANRVRTLLIKAMAELMSKVDLYVAPSWTGRNLTLTNLTGHPTVVMPNGFDDDDMPTSITLTGRLFDETAIITAAKAYQDATGWHNKHPQLKV